MTPAKNIWITPERSAQLAALRSWWACSNSEAIGRAVGAAWQRERRKQAAVPSTGAARENGGAL